LLELSCLSKNDPFLSPTYPSIGATLEKLGDLDQALKYVQCSIDITYHISEFDTSVIAIYYSDIGRIFFKQERSSQPLDALEFQQKSRVTKNDCLAEIYYNLSVIYAKFGLYKQAEEHALKAVDIAIIVFGQDHQLVKKYRNHQLTVIPKI
jgi:tetratricopeptide (TPR) repeat protein